MQSAENFVRRCAEQKNPPVAKRPLLQLAIKYYNLMDAGFQVSLKEVPAPVAEAVLILKSKINEYKREKQMSIKQNMQQGRF